MVKINRISFRKILYFTISHIFKKQEKRWKQTGEIGFDNICIKYDILTCNWCEISANALFYGVFSLKVFEILCLFAAVPF